MNEVEKELLDLEERQWRANREADAEFYRRYCADNFVIVSRFGVLTKDQVLAQFAKGNVNPFLRTEMEEPRVLTIGQDSALVTYKETIEASIDAEGGKTRTFSIYASTVYRRTADGWRFVFHQQTPL
jgi:hypothetical protein